MSFETSGPRPVIGEIDARCISTTNELPALTPEQARSHTWTPDAAAWDKIKKHSVTHPAEVTIAGLMRTKQVMRFRAARFPS